MKSQSHSHQNKISNFLLEYSQSILKICDTFQNETTICILTLTHKTTDEWQSHHCMNPIYTVGGQHGVWPHHAKPMVTMTNLAVFKRNLKVIVSNPVTVFKYSFSFSKVMEIITYWKTAKLSKVNNWKYLRFDSYYNSTEIITTGTLKL